jgi:photosystem II stability/assembly factor-like uncharacterized protein
LGTILQDTDKHVTPIAPEQTKPAALPRRGRYPMALVILSLVGTLILLAGVGFTLMRTRPSPQTPTQTAAPLPGVPAQAIVVSGHVLLGVGGEPGWADVTPATFGAKDLVEAQFLTSKVGWVADAQMTQTETKALTIYQTSDGGAHWKSVAVPWRDEGIANLLDLQFVDARHGWLMVGLSEATSRRAGFLFTTSDGGQTWTKLTAPYGGAIRFRDATTGWLIGGGVAAARNLISVTHDGGKTWQPQPMLVPGGLELSDRQIGIPAFATTHDGVTAVNYGAQVYLYTTRDGGATWLTTTSFPVGHADRRALPLVAISGQEGWALVGSMLYGTHDGGATWTAIRHSANLFATQSIGRTDATSGWASVARGYNIEMFAGRYNNTMLLVTTDGGATWTPATVTQPRQS